MGSPPVIKKEVCGEAGSQVTRPESRALKVRLLEGQGPFTDTRNARDGLSVRWARIESCAEESDEKEEEEGKVVDAPVQSTFINSSSSWAKVLRPKQTRAKNV